MKADSRDDLWSALPIDGWRDTYATLHRWTQIVGKIRLALTPWLNHGWHVPLYVSVRGLRTSAIPYRGLEFEIEFDFIDHRLKIDLSDGRRDEIALRPRSVAEFHADLMSRLESLGVVVHINERPSEIADAVEFSRDHEHAAYDAEYAHRFWRALSHADRVFKLFRTGFVGKASPVHFFWGSFDLAVTRFSGRRAPAFEGRTPGLALAVMREAYSHELSSAGFWPGIPGEIDPSFYSYAYPQPNGFQEARVAPDEAYFHSTLREFVLPYEAVRRAADPDSMLLTFLQSTYDAAADAGSWERETLECSTGIPLVPTQPRWSPAARQSTREGAR